MGRNLSGHIFIVVFYATKTSKIIILLSLFGNFALWNVVNVFLMILYSSFCHITTVFILKSHNKYLWIELKTYKLGMNG